MYNRLGLSVQVQGPGETRGQVLVCVMSGRGFLSPECQVWAQVLVSWDQCCLWIIINPSTQPNSFLVWKLFVLLKGQVIGQTGFDNPEPLRQISPEVSVREVLSLNVSWSPGLVTRLEQSWPLVPSLETHLSLLWRHAWPSSAPGSAALPLLR